jgi:predicted KAP-like P-loop ATPase
MLSNDQPIDRPGDDLYRRKGFALTLAQSIFDSTYAKNGFVFAITGDWGTGKSSVLRLIERYLLHIDMRQRLLTPLWWQQAGSEKTIEQIEEMALLYEKVEPDISIQRNSHSYLLSASMDFQLSICRKVLADDDAAKLALCYWHQKEKAVEDPRTVVVHFSPWLIAGRAELASALLSEMARALGAVLGDPVRKAFAELLGRLGELAPLAGAGANMAVPGISAFFNAAGSASSAAAKRLTTGETLDHVRAQLSTILRNLDGRKVLVIVDDIDRLTPDEAAETIALVKSVGDFPNVMYLLSYDRNVVRNQLKKALKVNGNRYLEKIVQHEIELPPIDDTDLLRAVDASINAIFRSVMPLDKDRLSELWDGVLRHYIKNPRDARRYFNPLAMAQSGLAEFTDPIDLMALQALHVFEPDVYKYVRGNIGDFVGGL